MISNTELLSLAIGVLLPLLVSFVTKDVTRPGVKAVLLLALAAVSGFGTALYTALNSGAEFNWKVAAVTFGGTFLVGIGAHFGLWKPTTLADLLQSVRLPTIDAGTLDTSTPTQTVVPTITSAVSAPVPFDSLITPPAPTSAPTVDTFGTVAAPVADAPVTLPVVTPVDVPVAPVPDPVPAVPVDVSPAPVVAPTLPPEVIAAAQTIAQYASTTA